ncbi:MAG: hypothetical protein ABI794_16020 [Betaproteobacteria bacterium]
MPTGCPDRDGEQPNLCKAHCAAGQQQTAQGAVDLPPLSLVHGLTATLFVPAAASSGFPGDVFGATPYHGTDPPIAIRNCCFRL